MAAEIPVRVELAHTFDTDGDRRVVGRYVEADDDGDEDDGSPADDWTPRDSGIGVFVCDTCHRSWPLRRNATPDADADTCPDCADNEAEGDGGS